MDDIGHINVSADRRIDNKHDKGYIHVRDLL